MEGQESGLYSEHTKAVIYSHEITFHEINSHVIGSSFYEDRSTFIKSTTPLKSTEKLMKYLGN